MKSDSSPFLHKLGENSSGFTHTFWCPACKSGHGIRKGTWSISFDENGFPTINPSILVRGGKPHENAPDKMAVCHSYVRSGKIQYLNDCTHVLAGQTIDMEEF